MARRPTARVSERASRGGRPERLAGRCWRARARAHGARERITLAHGDGAHLILRQARLARLLPPPHPRPRHGLVNFSVT